MKEPRDFPMGKIEQYYYCFRVMAAIVMFALLVASIWKILE